MIKSILLSLLNVICLAIFGQFDEEELFGSWKVSGTQIMGKMSGIGEGITMINSFYPDFAYQQYYEDKSDSAKAEKVVFGTWKIERGKMLVIEFSTINVGAAGGGERRQQIISLTGSTLVLEFMEVERGRTNIYHERVADEPKRANFQTPLVQSSPEVEYENQFYLKSKSDPSKKKKHLNGATQCTLNYSRPSLIMNVGEEFIEASGYPYDLQVDKLCFHVHNESVYYKENELLNFLVSRDYGSDYPIGDVERCIPLLSLESMDLQTAGAFPVSIVGSACLTLGLLGSLVVAPLVSINFKNGNVSMERYFATAGVGVSLVAVSIPLLVFSRSKTYRLRDDPFCEEEDLWHVVKE